MRTLFLSILNFNFVEYFLVNYKNKLAIGAQCNSLQQFSYSCIMSPFIHFPFKLINLIFPVCIKWKFAGEITSITLNSFYFTGIPLEKGWPELSIALQTCPCFMQQCSPYSFYPVPFQTRCILGTSPRCVYCSPLHPAFLCCGVFLKSRSVQIRSRISQCSSQKLHSACWKDDSPALMTGLSI